MALSSSPARADVKADEKTRVELAGMLGRVVNIFGGRGARERVTSFAELRRRFEEQQRKAAENARREEPSAKEKPAERDPNAKDIEIDFDVKNTGQTKTLNGFQTREAVMTVTVREKGKTLEQGGGMKPAIGKMTAEGARLEGTAIQTTTTMDAVAK